MKTARLVLGYLRHNLMSSMAYRGAFFLQVFGMILNNTRLLFFWWVLFDQLPTLRGWDLAQVMILFGILAFGFGVANVVCSGSRTTRPSRPPGASTCSTRGRRPERREGASIGSARS